MKKRLLSILLASSMVLTSVGSVTVSAASAKPVANFNSTGFPIVKDKIKLKAVSASFPGLPTDYNQSEFFKTMEKKTNISFEFYLIPNANWAEKFNLIFASGDLPDVFIKTPMNLLDIMSYTQQGYLVNLKPLIDSYGPNVQKLLKDDEDFKLAITMPDGKIPTLPVVTAHTPETPVWLNKEWMDKLNLSMPKNVNQLYNVYKAFKEKDPNGNGKADEIPLVLNSNNSNARGLKLLMAGFGLLLDQETDMFVHPDTGKLIYSPQTDNFKDALKYFKKLYDEKLLDNEVFTQNQAQARTKTNDPETKVGSFVSAGPINDVGAERLYKYVTLSDLTAADGFNYWSKQTRVNPGRFAITSKNKYPEATFRWADYLYSEEGGITTWMGTETVDYKINADGSWDWILKKGEDEAALRNRVTMQPGGNYVGIVPDLWEKTSSKAERYLNEQKKGKMGDKSVKSLPTIYFERADQKQLSTYTADINAYVNQSIAQFVTGAKDIDSTWPDYLNTLKKMGVENMIKIVQKGYDQATKNK